ncbi:MAG: anhydro-N-acetylmuramic acid kinase [Calothrix sp. C42_A2020_038]|nr:anhydro-N-acetylmuramic acid kinase [Calothrix sp. C42_A2020_038]
MTRVIGLMSGTSVDGIDAALVDISGQDLDIQVELVAKATYPYPTQLRERILSVCAGEAISMAELAFLDDAIAQAFAEAALNIQSIHESATLIGSHGQTVYHRPPSSVVEVDDTNLGYSLQLGRGALIAALTGITTVCNFRAADIAAGGQGAPLVPRIDAALLAHLDEARCIQNIGGIGNVTFIPARHGDWLSQIRGWDTGPGNSLLDLAVNQLSDSTKNYDENGEWASSGHICQPLVEKWLQHEYFQAPPPKSTGRELFGVDYVKQCFYEAQAYQLSPADFLATLTELTAASIVYNYRNFLAQMPQRVLLCGGGSRNLYLKQRLKALLEPIPVTTTDEVGINADFKEAIAFAVLAYWRQIGCPGNLPSVTGARYETLLGEVCKW